MVLSGQGDPAGFKTPELKHSVWSVIDVIVEIERDLSNSIHSNSISGVKSIWTNL